METGQLVKCLDAHFARIIDIQPLTVGNWNSVITSSIDRTVKVWNINYIFEQVHHIDRHELPIDSVTLSTDAGIAVVVTRNCIGIWDILTGKVKTKLADSALGAIVTHAAVTDNGEYIVAAESGFVIYWKVDAEAVIFKEEQKDILQVMLYDDKRKSMILSKHKSGAIGNVQLFVNLIFILCARWRFKIVGLQTKLASLAIRKKSNFYRFLRSQKSNFNEV